jgi:hypothetical protein
LFIWVFFFFFLFLFFFRRIWKLLSAFCSDIFVALLDSPFSFSHVFECLDWSGRLFVLTLGSVTFGAPNKYSKLLVMKSNLLKKTHHLLCFFLQ